jgi:hypothetical protein
MTFPFYTCAMPEPVYQFSVHIGTLCGTRDTNVHKLGAKLGIDPARDVAHDQRQGDADQGVGCRAGEVRPGD